MVACPRPVAAEVVRGSWILKYISFLKPADLRMCLMGGVIRGEEAGVTLRYLAKPPEQGASINRSGKGCGGGRLGVRWQTLIFRLTDFEMCVNRPSGGVE